MSEDARTVGARPGIGRRILGVVRPMYDALLGDPFREGRLRLEGTARLEREVTRLGLVALFALLVSVLFADLWRSGPLLSLSNVGGRYTFLPAAIFPVTMIAFALAWLLLLWGGVRASLPVRLAVAVLFLLANPFLGSPISLHLEGVPALTVGPLVVRIGYFAAPGLVALSAVLSVRETWERRARPFLFVGIALALAATFGALIWMNAEEVHRQLAPALPLQASGSILNVQSLLLPLVLISSVAVIEFGYGVAEAASAPLWSRRANVAKILAAGLIAVKLGTQLVRHLGEWASYVARRPIPSIRVVLSFAFLGVVALAASKLRRDDDAVQGAQERLTFGGAFAYALTTLIPLVGLILAEFLLAQTKSTSAYGVITRHLPTAWLQSYGDTILWGAIAVAGGFLWARGRSLLARDLGVGMVLIGVWDFVPDLLRLLDRNPGFRQPLLDILVTVAAGTFLAVRWRRVDTAGALRVGALVLFSWLVFTNGDFLSILGGFVGLPAIVVVVFGVLFSLLADSAFASGDGRRFPRASRPLLWVGYLLLSATIINWLEVTRGSDLAAGASGSGFFFLGIPLAAWLVARRPFRPPTAGEDREERTDRLAFGRTDR